MADQIAYTVIQQDGTCFHPPSSCTLPSHPAHPFHFPDDKEQPTLQDLRKQLETGKDEQKIEAMKKILLIMLNGDPMPQLLMHVIRFVVPSKNKALKKLLLVYWEVCPKTNPDGKLKQEMVLVW